MRNWRRLATGIAVAALAVASTACDRGAATIDVRPNERFQVMQGWEAHVSGPTECHKKAWANNLQRVLDLAANDLGINRVRLPVRASTEDSIDHFSAYWQEKTSFDAWKATWHRTVNDDADPQTYNAGGFQWAYLDYGVEAVVLPLRERARRRGDDLWVNLEYVGARTATLHQKNPEEYAELMVAAFEHLREKYALVPNSLEIINEPNRARWSAVQVAHALLAVKRRLDARGFHPQYLGPSITTIHGSRRYLDTMLTVPGVREALTDVTYHRYGGGPENLRVLHERASSLGYRTAMLEMIGADVDVLHEDLTIGHVSAWQQFGLAHCPEPGKGEGGGIYIVFHQVDLERGDARLAPKSRMLRQYFRYVHIGARRLRASSSNPEAKSTAFVNPDGRFVVVVNDRRPRVLRVRGLPAGTYGITYTTAKDDNVALRDTTLRAGEDVRVTLPDSGVLTIFGK